MILNLELAGFGGGTPHQQPPAISTFRPQNSTYLNPYDTPRGGIAETKIQNPYNAPQEDHQDFITPISVLNLSSNRFGIFFFF